LPDGQSLRGLPRTEPDFSTKIAAMRLRQNTIFKSDFRPIVAAGPELQKFFFTETKIVLLCRRPAPTGGRSGRSSRNGERDAMGVRGA
jgi:hypothetical protein